MHLSISFAQNLDRDAALNHETGTMTSDPHFPTA